MTKLTYLLISLFFTTALGCSTIKPTQHDDLSLPQQLVAKAIVLNSSDPDYSRAMLTNAEKPPGKGGISSGLVVKVTQDISVYRLWNGPAKKDTNGNTNRLGSWWSYDPPSGSIAAYRISYEVCNAWNDLTWLATCTLKAGSVVAIGPGQSVTAETCDDKTGVENYPPNTREWQTYIDKPWSRPQELQCPDVTADYEVDPDDISKRK